MNGLFKNAEFGTKCITRDGGKALYLAHILYNDTHKILVQGFEKPFMFNSDGRRRGGGIYASKCGRDLDIVKILD